MPTLIFEHAGLDQCLENAIALVAPGGTLSVVLQLPSTTAPAAWIFWNVSRNPQASIVQPGVSALG